MHIEEPLRLWDGVAPGSEGWTWQERDLRIPGPVTDFVFLLNVVEPTLTPVLPDPEVATGTAVVVCPGGAYAALAVDHEGFDVARWFAARGITAFVLKYRVMETPRGDDMGVLAQAADPAGLESILRRMDEFAPIPLADGLAALRCVREHAPQWNIDLDRLGAVGFSAGARLVLELATLDDPEIRPAFVGSIYGPGRDWNVPGDAPPLFLAAAADDPLFDGSRRRTRRVAIRRPARGGAPLQPRRPRVRHGRAGHALRPVDRPVPLVDHDGQRGTQGGHLASTPWPT